MAYAQLSALYALAACHEHVNNAEVQPVTMASSTSTRTVKELSAPLRHVLLPRTDASPEAVADALHFANGPSDGGHYWLNTLMPPSGWICSHIVRFSVDFLAGCAQLNGKIGLWQKQLLRSACVLCFWCLCSLCQFAFAQSPLSRAPIALAARSQRPCQPICYAFQIRGSRAALAAQYFI